jgi:hypothetical protein
VVDRFVKQLDGCSYYPGGYNCTAASEAMWLYRASAGKIQLSSCQVRAQTGDRSGGLTLEQAQAVSTHYGQTGGRLYKPTTFDILKTLLLTHRYGAIVQIGYAAIAGTSVDCFDGNFRGGHAVFVRDGQSGFASVGDPGADGRRPSIPTGWQSYSWSLLEKACAALPLGNGSLLGPGKAYAYMTPADEIRQAPTYKATVTVNGTRLWNDATKRWVYSLAKGTVLTVRGAKYPKGGKSCYPVTGPAPYTGPYYVPRSGVRLG